VNGSGGVYTIDVDPDALETAAFRWEQLADLFEQVGEQLSVEASAIGPGEWSGFTRDAACTEMAGLGRELGRFAPVLRTATQALRRVADQARDAVEVQLPALLRQRQEALAQYESQARVARAQGEAFGAKATAQATGRPDPTAAALERAGQDRDQALRGLDRRFEDLTQDLHEAFRRTATVIAQATVAPVSSGSRTAFATGGLGALLDGAAGLQAAAGAAAFLRETLPWTCATLNATRATELAQTLISAPDRLTAPDLTELQTLIDTYRGDRMFASEFLTALGGQGLIDLNARLVLSIPRAVEPTDDYTRLVEATGKMQTTLGYLLATATTAPGQGDQVTKEWVTDLARAARRPLGEEPPRANLYGYHLLGPLLGHGNYSAAFLNPLASDMLAFERSQGHPPGSAFWTNATTTPLAPPRLDYTTPIPVADYDPVAALLAAASRDPATARAFLTYDTGKYPEEPYTGVARSDLGPRLNRLDYLLTDRAWDPYPGRDDNPGLIDLGNLLTQATIADPKNPDSLRIVAAIAHEIYINKEATKSSLETTDLVQPGLRSALGQVFSVHIDSLHQTFRPGSHPMSLQETRLILSELGKDPVAYDKLINAVKVHTALFYDNDLRTGTTADRVAGLQTISRPAGEMLGSLDYGGVVADSVKTKANEKPDTQSVYAAFDVATALVDTGITLGSAATGLTAGPAGVLVSAAAGETMKAGAHAALERLEASLTDTDTGSLDTRTRRATGADTLAGLLDAAIIRRLPETDLKEAKVRDAHGNIRPRETWTPAGTDLIEKALAKLESPDKKIETARVAIRSHYSQGWDNAKL
jgi:uncharacterized protein YukE